MPYRKKYGGRKRKRTRSTRTTRKVGKKLLSDARRPGTNSSLEKAVKLIAKKEARKLLPSNLILRNFWFADYNNVTDVFTNMTALDRTGLVVAIGQVALMDQDVNPVPAIGQAGAQVIFPEMRPNPQHLFGANVVGPRRGYDGYRRGPDITVKNIQFGLNLKLPFIPQGTALPWRDYTTVYWRLVAVEEQSQLQALAGHKPNYNHLHRLPTFGFTSRLDKAVQDPQQGMKIDVLAKGTFRMKYSYLRSDSKKITIFRDLGGGIKMSFYPGDPPYPNVGLADIYGQRVVSKKKLYLAIAGDVAPGVAGVFKPTCAAYTKIGYTDI